MSAIGAVCLVDVVRRPKRDDRLLETALSGERVAERHERGDNLTIRWLLAIQPDGLSRRRLGAAEVAKAIQRECEAAQCAFRPRMVRADGLSERRDRSALKSEAASR